MRMLETTDAPQSVAGNTGRHLPALSARSAVIAAHGAQAVGAFAIGALAFGAMAIGALALGRLAVGHARIRRLEIDELVVHQLRVVEQEPDRLKVQGGERPFA